jgi:hypothetical protein
MKKQYNAILVLVFLTAFATIGFADKDRNFKADLTGAEEVPPIETDTTGKAKFKVNKDFTEIDFKLEIKNAFGILGVAGAHIHCAPAGENGPVVAFLAGVLPGGLAGKVKINATLSEGNIINDKCGATIAELVESMEDGDTYVNVHSPTNPSGEIRGQISNNSDDDD